MTSPLIALIPLLPFAGFVVNATMGRVLFTDYMFAFEVTSILILAAMLGAVLLARRPGPGEL